MVRRSATRRELLATAAALAASSVGVPGCSRASNRPRASHVVVPANAFARPWTAFFSQISAMGGATNGAPTTHELELSFDPSGAARQVTAMLEWAPPGGLLSVQGTGGQAAHVRTYKAGEVQPIYAMGLASPATFLDSGALPRLAARYPADWYTVRLQQMRPLAPSALVKPPVMMPDLSPAGPAAAAIFANSHLAWMFMPTQSGNGGFGAAAMIVAE